MRKLPNPRNSTLSPLARASVMLSKIVLTIVSVSFFVRFESFETSSISSAFVIVIPPPPSPVDGPRSSPQPASFGPRGTLARPRRECQPYWGVSGQPTRALGQRKHFDGGSSPDQSTNGWASGEFEGGRSIHQIERRLERGQRG